MDTPYPDLDRFEFTHGGLSRTVFRTGMGPAVIVMHEVPGLYPEVVDFGRAVAAEGLTVFMPSLAGTPGRGFSLPYNVQTLVRVCIAREFTVFATRRASAITEWLRALARQAHTACGGPGVGAVGMCLTGGFALGISATCHHIGFALRNNGGARQRMTQRRAPARPRQGS